DALFEIEGRVAESGRFRTSTAVHEQRDAGIPFGAVPVAPVAFRGKKQRGYLVGRRFDFLQADDVGLLGSQQLLKLTLPGAHAVDVPGNDLHARNTWRRLRCALSTPGPSRLLR